MGERKDVLRARKPAHQCADCAEAGSTSKLNTTNHATIAFKPESLWRKSNQKTGSVHTSDALYALNHISPTAKNVEDATMPSNRLEDANLSQTNLSSLRTLSNMPGHLNRHSLQDIKPFHKGPTTPDILAPEGLTHSRTSNQTLLPDPLINNPDINLPYE